MVLSIICNMKIWCDPLPRRFEPVDGCTLVMTVNHVCPEQKNEWMPGASGTKPIFITQPSEQ